MKRYVLVVTVAMLTYIAGAQSIVDYGYSLALKKVGSNNSSPLFIKQNKKVTIKTNYGGELTTKNYSVLNGQIVFNEMDTVATAEIISIKGRVKGQAGRKMLGGALATGGLLAGGSIHSLNAWSSGYSGSSSGSMAPIPFYGIAVGGLILMGPKTFNTNEIWELVTVKKDRE